MEPNEIGQDEELGSCDQCGTFSPTRFCSAECQDKYYEELEAAYNRAVNNGLGGGVDAKRLRFVLECTDFLERVRTQLRMAL